MKTNRRAAFSLFELIAVMSITGIVFMVVLGSYNSWSSIHSCNGAARILKAGLVQARTLAQTKNRYVAFEFSTFTSNRLQQVSGYQIYICTNNTGNTEQLLNTMLSSASLDDQQSAVNQMGISYAAPYQRLSSHIRLVSAAKPADLDNPDPGALLFFRPNGSVWNGSADTHSHYAGIYSKQLFNQLPLTRILRIDLATGAIEIIRTERKR